MPRKRGTRITITSVQLSLTHSCTVIEDPIQVTQPAELNSSCWWLWKSDSSRATFAPSQPQALRPREKAPPANLDMTKSIAGLFTPATPERTDIHSLPPRNDQSSTASSGLDSTVTTTATTTQRPCRHRKRRRPARAPTRSPARIRRGATGVAKHNDAIDDAAVRTTGVVQGAENRGRV